MHSTTQQYGGKRTYDKKIPLPVKQLLFKARKVIAVRLPNVLGMLPTNKQVVWTQYNIIIISQACTTQQYGGKSTYDKAIPLPAKQL